MLVRIKQRLFSNDVQHHLTSDCGNRNSARILDRLTGKSGGIDASKRYRRSY